MSSSKATKQLRDLLKKGEDQPEKVKELLAKGAEISTADQYGSLIDIAATNGLTGSIKVMVEAGGAALPQMIWIAFNNGHMDAFHYLFEVVEKREKLPAATLNEALCNMSNADPDKIDMLKTLAGMEEVLKRGANPNAGATQKVSRLGLPIVNCVRFPGTEVPELLVKYGADVKLMTQYDGTQWQSMKADVLVACIRYNRPDLYQYFRKLGATFDPGVLITCIKLQIPISEEILEDIMKDPQFNNDYIDPETDNNIFLTAITAWGRRNARGPNDPTDYTIFLTLLIKFLVQKAGVDPNQGNGKSRMPLSSIRMPDDIYHDHSISKVIELLNLLLSLGLDINQETESTTQQIYTIAHNAGLYHSGDAVIQLLLEKKYDFNRSFNCVGMTALMDFALSIKSQKYLELIVKSCDLDKQDHKGDTALHYAARSDNPEAYDALMKNGASTKIKNHQGKTPEAIAEQLMSSEVLNYITTGSLPNKIENWSGQSQLAIPGFKFVFVGDGAVGKTCMLISQTTGKFPDEYIPTVFDNYNELFMFRGQPVNAGYWDTVMRGDSERLLPLSFPQTDVFIMCFSVISPTSFENIMARWYPMIHHHCPDAKRLLVGTKCDLREDKETHQRLREKGLAVVSFDQAVRRAKEIGAEGYVECSAVTREGLARVFHTAIHQALLPRVPRQKHSKSCLLF